MSVNANVYDRHNLRLIQFDIKTEKCNNFLFNIFSFLCLITIVKLCYFWMDTPLQCQKIQTQDKLKIRDHYSMKRQTP